MVEAEDWASWVDGGAESLQALAQKANRTLGHGRGAARAVLFTNGRAGVWRTNQHGGLLRHLGKDRYASPQRLQEEVALSGYLRKQGVATPEVLMALAEKRGSFWRQHLVTAEILGARTVFAAEEQSAMWEAVQSLLQQVFDLGLWATDLHPGNLLWENQEKTCWLIDLAGAKILPQPLAPAQRKARLERFLRYYLKHAGAVPRSAEKMTQELLAEC